MSRFLALLLLIPGLPIIAVLAALVRLTSRGPAIYCQSRVGYRGREFMLYKIRSMRHNAEASTGPVWAAKNDSRVTPLGGFLRASHLDELPQLFNVLRGDMRLVGPRPERPEIVRRLQYQVPGYTGRLEVPAGVTGLAQVCLPADSDLNSVREKLSFDLAYIKNKEQFALVDLRIFTATVLTVFGISGPFAAKICGLSKIQSLAAAVEPAEEAYAKAA